MRNENQTIIDEQFKKGEILIKYLESQNELTLLSEAQNNFSKNLLLSAASYFEKELCDIIMKFAQIQSNNNDLIISIIKMKVIKRQYHTYFNWDSANNANSFFTLFGENFKDQMIKRVKDDSKLDDSIKAFLQLGQERNKLVHLNFAEIVLDKTSDDVYNLYKNATHFVDVIETELTTT